MQVAEVLVAFPEAPLALGGRQGWGRFCTELSVPVLTAWSWWLVKGTCCLCQPERTGLS